MPTGSAPSTTGSGGDAPSAGMTDVARVQVSVVTYDSAGTVAPCLESVRAAADGVELRVTVIDNASTDGTAALSRERFGESGHYGFIVRSGRAVLVPVFKEMYERRSPPAAQGESFWRDIRIQWSKDIGRSLDYLEELAAFDAQARRPILRENAVELNTLRSG